MLCVIQGTVDHNTWTSMSIDAKCVDLVPRIRKLYDHVQQVRCLLPERENPKEYPIGRELICPSFFYTGSEFACDFSADHHFRDSAITHCKPAAQVALFLGVACSIFFGISRRAGNFIMSMISLLVGLASQHGDGSIDDAQKDIHRQIPNRIETALKCFDLDGRTTTYAMCPSCHKGHAPEFKPNSTTPCYPQHCVNKILESGVCGEGLLDCHGPILPFVYHHLDDFVASLLACKDLERDIDHACDDLMASLSANDAPPTFIHDIFGGEFMRTFTGPDNKTLFVDRSSECRLAFSICIDFFNIGGLRTRGQTASSGLIALACLNLPFEKRHKPQNMYCSIIPGPRAPRGAELNHYMVPLVNDFLDSWNRGVHYQRTILQAKGWVACSTIVCVACDLFGTCHVSRLSVLFGLSLLHYF